MRIKWYLIIIALSGMLGSLVISLLKNISYPYVLLVMLIGIVLVIIVDAITATISRLLPLSFAEKENQLFPVSKKERRVYEKLQIKKWKDKIPEIGHLTGFRKNKIADPKNPSYIHRFINESSYGEIGHFISVFTGFLLLFLPWFNDVWMEVSLVVSIVNGILNILPIMVLRYNKFILVSIYQRMKKD